MHVWFVAKKQSAVEYSIDFTKYLFYYDANNNKDNSGIQVFYLYQNIWIEKQKFVMYKIYCLHVADV